MIKKTLIIGASSKPEQDSNKAISALVNHKIPVVAIGQRTGEVAGITIHTKTIPLKAIHTVSLYINIERQREYYNYIISLNPKRIIFNPGTENIEFCNLLKANNIKIEEASSLSLLSTNQY